MQASLRNFGPRALAVVSVALAAGLLCSLSARAQDDGTSVSGPQQNAPGFPVRPLHRGPGVRPALRQPGMPQRPGNSPANAAAQAPVVPPPPPTNRASIAPQDGSRVITPQASSRLSRGGGGPPAVDPGDKKEAGANAKEWSLTFDKRDLAEVIQQVADITQRNFILPERVSGKITILTNKPVPADEVWNVFLAALDANNWAVYQVGHYWKLSEKKQSSRSNIPTLLDSGDEPPANEQMVTKLFKLHYVDADQMRNTINQFTTRDSDFQIFPPDTLIISDLGLNMRRLERLIEQLDQPGGSEEIHVVQAQYGTAAELAQKLTEIFVTQQQKVPGGQRQLGVAEPVNGAQAGGAGTNQAGPLSVSKVIAEDRTNKLIIIASAKSFQRVLDLLRQIDVPGGENGVHVYYLDNAKAEDLATTMQTLAQGVSAKKKSGAGAAPGGAPGAASGDLFTGDVKITADKNTNALVIVASNSDYRNLVKVIQQLDVPRRQVFVEAVIMEISLEDDFNAGASLHGGKVINNSSGSLPLVFGSELGSLNSLGGVTSLASLNGFLAGLQGPPLTIPGLNLTIPSFGILLNALQSSSDVNIISTPTVTMTDNSEGEITVGQNVPFQAGYSPGGALSSLASAATGSTASTATSSLLGSSIGLGGLGSLYAPIQRQNVELRLKIKPQINQGDYVRLEIDEQTEQIASTDPTLGPTTSKRSAKTTLLAKDQETVVIGGLIQEQTIKGSSRTPVLGSIPVLGWLFRSDTSKKIKTNILLFLTPYIIRDPSDYRRIFERKMAERAEFVKRFTGADANYVTAIDYARKASPLARLSRTVDTEFNKVENGGAGISSEKLIQPSNSAQAPRNPAPVNSGGPTGAGPVNSETWPASAPANGASQPSGASAKEPAAEPPASEPGAVIAHPELEPKATPGAQEPGSVPPDLGPADNPRPPEGTLPPTSAPAPSAPAPALTPQ